MAPSEAWKWSWRWSGQGNEKLGKGRLQWPNITERCRAGKKTWRQVHKYSIKEVTYRSIDGSVKEGKVLLCMDGKTPREQWFHMEQLRSHDLLEDRVMRSSWHSLDLVTHRMSSLQWREVKRFLQESAKAQLQEKTWREEFKGGRDCVNHGEKDPWNTGVRLLRETIWIGERP